MHAERLRGLESPAEEQSGVHEPYRFGPDLHPWIRTELIRISGSGGEEDGQEQAYGSADHRWLKLVEAGRTVDDVARECGRL
jgi:hypothetical protein